MVETDLVGQLLRQRRTDVFAACGGLANCIDQIRRCSLFAQKARCTRFERAYRILVLSMDRQNQHQKYRHFLLDLLEYFNAGSVGQYDVEQENIAIAKATEFDGLQAVFGAADDDDVLGATANLFQSFSHDGMIVGNGNFNGSTVFFRHGLWKRLSSDSM